MKLKFKQQGFQTDSVMAVADCFLGQPLNTGLRYRIDPGRAEDKKGQLLVDYGDSGFRNHDPPSRLPKSSRTCRTCSSAKPCRRPPPSSAPPSAT